MPWEVLRRTQCDCSSGTFFDNLAKHVTKFASICEVGSKKPETLCSNGPLTSHWL